MTKFAILHMSMLQSYMHRKCGNCKESRRLYNGKCSQTHTSRLTQQQGIRLASGDASFPAAGATRGAAVRPYSSCHASGVRSLTAPIHIGIPLFSMTKQGTLYCQKPRHVGAWGIEGDGSSCCAQAATATLHYTRHTRC